MSVTLSSLRTQIRDRADMKYSRFVTDTELNSLINLSLTELYDLLVAAFEDYYIADPYSFTISSGNSANVPSDFYKLIGLDYQFNGGEWVTLKRFNFVDRNKHNAIYSRYALGMPDLRYRLLGDKIKILPEDRASGTYRLWYIPRATLLSIDSDTLDGVNGWEEYIIVDCAIKCKEKEESDTSALQFAKQQIKKRIEEMAQNRDSGEPAVISDVNNINADFGLPYMR